MRYAFLMKTHSVLLVFAWEPDILPSFYLLPEFFSVSLPIQDRFTDASEMKLLHRNMLPVTFFSLFSSVCVCVCMCAGGFQPNGTTN